jgi:two-component system, cell cycle sensor histidine kinase and response regulator CckA
MEFADMSKEDLLKALIDSSEPGQTGACLSRTIDLQSLNIYVSGIAHEYNNLLTAIIGNLSLAKMYAKPGYEVYDVLTEAEKASVRAKDLTKQLLNFVQGSRPGKKPICLKKTLRGWICSALADFQIEPDFSIPEDLWPVEADELKLKKLIDDAVMNAQFFLPGGVLRIRAENVSTPPAGSELKKGKYVLISIEDGDTGISEKSALYGGSGRDIPGSSVTVQQDISIFRNSSPGGRTISSIFIPAINQATSSEEAGKTFPFGKGRILVMDDEEIVRLVVGKLLNQCGYDAELARNGEEMLSAYKIALHTGNPFNAVIIDLGVRDGMGGQEAVRHLLEIHPEAKAIVSSGYAQAPVMSSFEEFGFIGFLAKPYRLEELGKVLYEILSAKDE